MSYTPWSAGSTPVRNDGHAVHEWVGRVDLRTVRPPRSIRDCRFGRIPRWSRGSRMRQSAPSHPMTKTRPIYLTLQRAKVVDMAASVRTPRRPGTTWVLHVGDV